MTVCVDQIRLHFEGQTRPIDLSFDAPDLSSDGGILLLQQIERRLGICRRVAPFIPDQRDPNKVRHPREQQLRQRIFQIALGYEDQNDADRLRHDPLLKAACGKSPDESEALASQPTLSRFETSPCTFSLRAMILDFEKYYIDSLDPLSKAIILDIDTTDTETHGQQQLAFFNAYYNHYMYHPTLIFDGSNGQLVTALLRPGNAHAARGSGYVLERIIRKIRRKCPNAAILVRGDGAFSVPRLHERLEKLGRELGGVDFIFGQAQNDALKRMAAPFLKDARLEYGRTGEKVRNFSEFEYAAGTWSKERRIIVKAEYTSKGANPRFVVTSLSGEDPGVWYEAYCQRGQAENFIKELKNAMAADRLSSSSFVGNSFRLLLHSWAYRLMWSLREDVKEKSPQLGKVQFDTLRIHLLKVGVSVKKSVRRIWYQMPRSFPHRGLFRSLLVRGQAALVGT